MTDLITFHSDEAVKAKYLARVDRHIQADQLIRGTEWDGSKGCAVGCTLEAYDHALYPVELGIPEWLAWLEDSLFEGMSEPKSRTWPRDFLAATPVGVSADRLEREVKAPFMIFMLEDVKQTFDHAKHPAVLAAIDGVITLWGRPDIGSKDWAAAGAAATAAATAADWAAAARAAAGAATAAAAGAATAAATAADWAATATATAAAAARAAATATAADWAADWAATATATAAAAARAAATATATAAAAARAAATATATATAADWAAAARATAGAADWAAAAATAAATAARAAAAARAEAYDRYADRLLELLSGLSLREPA